MHCTICEGKYISKCRFQIPNWFALTCWRTSLRGGRDDWCIITSLASRSSLSEREVHLQYQSQRAVETGFRSFWLDLESWRRCAVKKLNSKFKPFSPANIGHPLPVLKIPCQYWTFPANIEHSLPILDIPCQYWTFQKGPADARWAPE